MRFELLGPLRVDAGQHEVPITAGRDQAMLAMLLLHANRPVTTDQLIDAIWGPEPPQSARNQLQGSVSRLRKQLADAGIGRVIRTGAGTYHAAVEPAQVDLMEFRRLVAQARRDAGDQRFGEASSAYRTALSLWRGPALAGIGTEQIQRAATVLDQERVQAQEECLDAELASGGGGSLVAELTDLVHRHPLRERLHRALMLALYRAGRHADALAAFRAARRLLHDELGTEPGAELQQLHQAILNRDPALEMTLRPARAKPAGPAPRELPGDVAGFTGRADPLETLDRLGFGEPAASGPMVIFALAGTAGVGKTALAVHWAHRAAHRFPDGQLFVDLRGYDPDRPRTPDDALAQLLIALGVSGQDIPAELDARAARYRTEVAGRRLLILLDNAASVEQIRPLLPGSGTCTVIVTSRDSLAGLVARHGAYRLELDLLPPAEAVALLRQLIGPRVEAEPDLATALAEQCARLPLALRVAAQLAIARPTASLADLVGELGGQERRLDLLTADGDPRTAVEAVFSWSIRNLRPEAARAFRLLGLHPGPDFEPHCVAALVGSTPQHAQAVLDPLVRAHLVHASGHGRYAMHDLLRAYAAQLATERDGSQECRAALSRLFDYYLAGAAAAMDTWHRSDARHRVPISPPVTPMPELVDPDVAFTWLNVERSCLVAVAAHAADHGWPTHALRLSAVLHTFLESRYFTDALAVHNHARKAAKQIGDRPGEAYVQRMLATVELRMGRLDTATDRLQQAIPILREAGDRAGEAGALNSLGIIQQRLGHYKTAAEHHTQALSRFQEAADQSGQARTLANLGALERRLGHYERAASRHEAALSLFRQVGDQTGEAGELNNLGIVEGRLGRYEEADSHFQQALTQFRKLGIPLGEAHVLDELGVVHMRLGDPGKAVESFRHALLLYRQLGDELGEAQALNGLAEAVQLAGVPTDAIGYHIDALTIAVRIGAREQEARANAGLGNAHRRLRDLVAARHHYQLALDLYSELGMPEGSDDTMAHLAALG